MTSKSIAEAEKACGFVEAPGQSVQLETEVVLPGDFQIEITSNNKRKEGKRMTIKCDHKKTKMKLVAVANSWKGKRSQQFVMKECCRRCGSVVRN